VNLRQVETFYWAAKLGSFSAAAERMNATQSTVSMRIREIERDFGIALFDRAQRTARLTFKGRELLRYAEEIMRISAEMRVRVADESASQGIIRIGVVEMISLTWLPRLVKTVHERYPKIALELDEALTQDLVDRLNQGTLDLILTAGRASGYNTSPISLGTVQFSWMASPRFRLPKKVLKPYDLQNFPIIGLSQESYHYKSIEDWFHADNAKFRRMDTCKSLGVAASLAAGGLGITLLPQRLFEREIKAKQLSVIETEPRFRPVEFTATSSTQNIHPIARKIGILAAAVSSFDKRSLKLSRRRNPREFPN
jgi:DNA-binding transcriptional LysR family regulator